MILSAWAFSRWMALIYLAAFWSLGTQIIGLVGHHGILPAADFLKFVQTQTGAKGFWLAPSLCWLNHSDAFLLFLCWGGAGLSVLLLLGYMPGLVAFLLWLFYLSLTTVGQDFLGFQWDNLLLEAGFLLIFLVPRPFTLEPQPHYRPSLIIIWLLRLLLFRLMFESGMVKLLSQDAHWTNLTALTYHYWSQPLPNPISWYAAQLPLWFQKFSCMVLFVIEIGMPFLIFFGRWTRLIAFFGIGCLQLLIMLTGNYCFFNLLAIGLCLTLLEDEHFNKILVSFPNAFVGNPVCEAGIAFKIITSTIAAFILIISVSMMAASLMGLNLSKPVEVMIEAISPLRSINNYGLFSVMTTQRNEIILEGSNDGEHWLPYEFYYKPGDVHKPLRFTGPFQPRLDWQMWFAALGSWRDNQWVLVFMQRLLEGEPSVEKLLAVNPFKNHPPLYIRATLWDYHFTNFKTRGAHGPLWQRTMEGPYCPTLTDKGIS